jgi:hypothetical protein
MDAAEMPPNPGNGPGGPRHGATELARELLAGGKSLRETRDILNQQGIMISIATLSRIRSGKKQTPAANRCLLAAGERRLATAVGCPVCRVPIEVVPCRVCGSTWPVELDEVNRAAERRTLALSQRRPGA